MEKLITSSFQLRTSQANIQIGHVFALSPQEVCIQGDYRSYRLTAKTLSVVMFLKFLRISH